MPTKPIPGFTFSLCTVLDEQSQRYSSTAVTSDRTATGHLRVNSNTQHHHAQSIWVRTDTGHEEHYTFNDAGIPAVRPGHRVLLSFAQKIGVVRVENLTSASWQIVAPYSRVSTKSFIILSAICTLFALLMPWAVSACITPLFGAIMLLVAVFDDRKWQHLHVYRTSTVGLACGLMASSSLLIILPSMDPHARQNGTVPAWPMFFFVGLWVWSLLIALKRRQEANEHLRHREAIEADFREQN